MSLLSEIKSFFEHPGMLPGPGDDRLVVAFSGGPDSTALLWGLKQMAPELGVRLHAVHIDHQLDNDSRRRATLARELSAHLGVEFSVLCCPVSEHSIAVEGSEAAARRIRYEVLETQRRILSAAYVVTAHHADDQIETLLIRILSGTGIEGLAGIQPRRHRIIRPLLNLRRDEIQQALLHSGLEPVLDSTNFDLRTTRNRVRHCLLPYLLEREPGLDESLGRLAGAAHRSRAAIEMRLRKHLQVRRTPAGASLDRQALEDLPQPLWSSALAQVHRRAGTAYPPSSAARRELQRQLASTSPVGVDCGVGWRWQGEGERLTLARPSPSVRGFAYTVQVPGECEIPELALRFRIRRGAVDAWMFRPSSHRAGLDLPIRSGGRVVVRSRRNGDRVRPFGCPYTRRLKDVLIDRRVPRHERSLLPLLEVNSRLAWIPGVTIDDAFRVEVGKRVWIAELESI